MSTPSFDSYDRAIFPPFSRLVKVYELIGSRWYDRAAGACGAEYDRQNKKIIICVRDTETGAEVFNHAIHLVGGYTKQTMDPAKGETVIVWTEPDGRDFGLSFEDADGCRGLWGIIGEALEYLACVAGDEQALSRGSNRHFIAPSEPLSSPSSRSSSDDSDVTRVDEVDAPAVHPSASHSPPARSSQRRGSGAGPRRGGGSRMRA